MKVLGKREASESFGKYPRIRFEYEYDEKTGGLFPINHEKENTRHPSLNFPKWLGEKEIPEDKKYIFRDSITDNATLDDYIKECAESM